jgi:hypothetical protein
VNDFFDRTTIPVGYGCYAFDAYAITVMKGDLVRVHRSRRFAVNVTGDDFNVWARPASNCSFGAFA